MHVAAKVCVASLVCLIPFAAIAQSNDGPAAQEFAKVAEGNSLVRENLTPWYLKLTYTIYNVQGKNPQPGTLEFWWVAPGKHRMVITSADFSETVPRDAEKLTSKGTRERFLLNDLLANILQPMPSPDRLQGTIITHEERTIGKAELDCFVVGSARSKVTLYRENFCTEPNEISLRLKTVGSSLLIRNRDAKFQSVEVAMDYTLSMDGKKTIDAQIADLRTTQPEAVPGRLTIPSDAVQHVPGVVLAGKIIEKQPPTYPEMARRNHIVGTVLLGAVIGKDGSVSSLAVIASPDESLSESAMDAVKHWKYEPYMLDGAPIPVATTIGVNFNMPR